MTHIDDWIDDPNTDTYAAWFFNLARLPAVLKFKFEQQLARYRLFCTYQGERYRVTGASRLGDVWLTKDFDRERGYDLRVAVDDCSDWSPQPEPQAEPAPVLQWSEIGEPCEEVRYHHVTAHTPFGRFLITWKGWKKYDAPTIDESPWGDLYGNFTTVEEAKAWAEQEYTRRLQQATNPTEEPAA